MRITSYTCALLLAAAGTGVAGQPAPTAPAPAPAAPAPAPSPAPSPDGPAAPSPPEALPADDEPALPAGLDDDDEPGLPAGLEEDEGEPALPTGLDGEAEASAAAPSSAGLPLQWRVVLELRGGTRVVADPVERTLSIGEVRLQLDLTKSWRPWSTVAQLVVDAVGDPLADTQVPELETGGGAIDLRTAALTMSPTSWLDVRIGRQTLTWGTGDLVFINDLFPKDWTAFLIGRHDDYLKAPSDAVKLAVFTPVAGLDVIATPRFDADRLPLRERLSSWDPLLGRLAGQDDPLALDPPDRWLRDGELALRVHRAVGSWELSGYGYRGFWKSPGGFSSSGQAVFPRLSVYGASVRAPALGGLSYVEAGYYDSAEDRGGRDPSIRNSELRAVVGHERQLIDNLTVGAQYYFEAMMNHADYEATLPEGAPRADQVRQVLTARLTYLALRQRLMLTAFVFASPSERDGYARASASYAVDDRWSVSIGANLLAGRDDHTFFGQLANNSNVYFGVRHAH